MEPDASSQGVYLYSPAPLVHGLVALLAKNINDGLALEPYEPFVLPPLSDLQLLPEPLWDGHPAAPAFDGREWDAPHHVLALTIAHPNLPDGTPQARGILGHVHPGTYVWGQFRGLGAPSQGLGAQGLGGQGLVESPDAPAPTPALWRRPAHGDIHLYIEARTALEVAYEFAQILVEAVLATEEQMLTGAMAREILGGGIADATLLPETSSDMSDLVLRMSHPCFQTPGPGRGTQAFQLVGDRAYPCVALWLPFSTRLSSRSHGMPPVLTPSQPAEGLGNLQAQPSRAEV